MASWQLGDGHLSEKCHSPPFVLAVGSFECLHGHGISLSLCLSVPGPYILEVTGEPAGGTPTSREMDLQATQNPGPLQKPTWQVSESISP